MTASALINRQGARLLMWSGAEKYQAGDFLELPECELLRQVQKLWGSEEDRRRAPSINERSSGRLRPLDDLLGRQERGPLE